MTRFLLTLATVLLLATTAHAQATLTWTDVATDETGYRVERAAVACTPAPADTAFAVIAASLPANATTYTDTTFAQGSTACYRVGAFNGAGVRYSNLAQFSPPAAPTGLTVR